MVKKNISSIFIGLFSILILANWGESETSVEGRNKQAVNFSGTLTTQQDQVYDVENIALGRKYEGIPLYEKPQRNDAAPTSSTENTAPAACPPCPKEKEQPYQLKNNPRDGIITKINLADVSAIRVPNPDAIWTYQQKRKGRKTEYIEIVITFKNAEANKEMSFLADMHRKISCDRTDATNNAIELEVPFNAIRSLVIKSYRHRKDENKETPKSAPSCKK